MFAYCNDNPVNGYDPFGSIPKLIEDIVEKTTRWVEAIRDALIETREREIPGTVVLGIDYLWGFGVGNSGNIGIGFDNNGNVGLVAGEYGGAGMPGVSLTAFLSISSARSLKGLEGNSLSVGGSGGEAGIIGVEVTIMPEKNNVAVAGTIQIGIGLGIPLEIHSQYGVTEVASFNIFDLLIRGCNYVLR